MAKKQVPSKEAIEEEKITAEALSIEAKAQELMTFGFTYPEAMAWLRKQYIKEAFEKDERIERWDS